MTAKEYLLQYRNLDLEINAMTEEVCRLRALAERVTTSKRSGGKGTVSDRVGNGAARIVDLEREIRELVDLRIEIKTVICRVKDRRLRAILRLRYILGRTAEKTAETIGISTRQESRLHQKALQDVKKILLSG